MAKPKKTQKTVKVQDLSAKKNPKGGLADKTSPLVTSSLPKFK